MNVGVIGQGRRPGVQDRQDSDTLWHVSEMVRFPDHTNEGDKAVATARVRPRGLHRRGQKACQKGTRQDFRDVIAYWEQAEPKEPDEKT